jgi:ribosome-binding protein aMBF1 (putative translation factor)
VIRNDRQLSIAREKQEALLSAASTAEANDAAVYLDLANEVQQEIDEYTAIRDGHVNLFAIESVDDLASAVIKARVARRWTQKQLADSLGVSEQMVQKDESRGYEKAGVARLAEVAEVLGYQLVGELRPIHLPPDQWKGPAGIVIGMPSGNWATDPPYAELKPSAPVTWNLDFEPLSQFLGLTAAGNFRLRTEAIETRPSWAETTVIAQQPLGRAES